MAVNPFVNGSKSIPKSDPQIVRVSMEEIEISGRKSHLPTKGTDSRMAIEHVNSSRNGSAG